jgi:hypothetical protein
MFGFLLALLTYLGNNRLAVLPAAAQVQEQGPGKYLVVVPGGSPTTVSLERAVIRTSERQEAFPMRVADSAPNFGVQFVTILVLVIIITNVSLRGLWSLVVILVVALLSIILALSGGWDSVLGSLSSLHIQINLAGYLYLSSALFVVWLLAVFFFDRQVYAIITPGQIRIREQIGAPETTYDTTGLSLAKQRDDLLRHWVLGMGSGDLIIRTAGANGREFVFPNVLFVTKKIMVIEELLRERAVVLGD